MESERMVWIAVLDGREGRLLRGRGGRFGGSGHCYLELVDSFENPLEELDGPSEGSPADVSPLRHATSRGSELLARYTVDLVKWLDGTARKLQIDELEVFASRRLHGLLVSMVSQFLAQRIREHVADLGRRSIPELQRSPELARLLKDDAAAKPRRAS